jgi:hypothetical protein
MIVMHAPSSNFASIWRSPAVEVPVTKRFTGSMPDSLDPSARSAGVGDGESSQARPGWGPRISQVGPTRRHSLPAMTRVPTRTNPRSMTSVVQRSPGGPEMGSRRMRVAVRTMRRLLDAPRRPMIAFDQFPEARPLSLPEELPTEGPLVSVVIPTWNNRPYIAACISSVLQQTYRSLEVHVLDDCSTDGTWEALRDMAAGDCRLVLSRNESNLGIYQNAIRGFDRASGELIKYVFADDVLTPQAIATLVSTFQAAPTVVLATSTSGRIDAYGGVVRDLRRFTPRMPTRPFVVPGAIAGNRMVRSSANFIGSPTYVLFRAAALQKFRSVDPRRWEQRWQPAFDALWWMQILSQGDLAYLPQPMTITRLHQGSSTASFGAGTRIALAWSHLLDVGRAAGFLTGQEDEEEALVSYLVRLAARLALPPSPRLAWRNARLLWPEIRTTARRLGALGQA